MKDLGSLGVMVVVMCAVVLVGCAKEGNESQTESPDDGETNAQAPAEGSEEIRQESNELQPEAQATALKDVLMSWQSGQQEDAANRFLAISWDDSSTCRDVPILEMSDRKFRSLPYAEAVRTVDEAMKLTSTLREIMVYVASLGDELAASGNSAAARQHLEAIRRYGRALASEEHIEVIRDHGNAAMEYADSKLSKIE